MSLCYDFQKWTMITLAAVAISLSVGLVLQYTNGQEVTNQTSAKIQTFDNCISMFSKGPFKLEFQKSVKHICSFIIEKNFTNFQDFENKMDNNITLQGEFAYRYGKDIQEEATNSTFYKTLNKTFTDLNKQYGK